MKDNLEGKIRYLQGQLTTHTILIECLIEVLYEKEIIDKATYSAKIEDKIQLLKKLNKDEKEDPSNPMFYGPHGEA